MSKILVIGDAHAKPDTDLSRFTWLGRMVVDEQPDYIIDMGDWEDMPSLSSYDMGKMSYEGRRYKRDLESAWEGRKLFNSPIADYNQRKKSNKERQYRPTKIALGGNHFERRVNRAIELAPMLEGTISVNDNYCEEYGWDYVPFLEPITIEGFTFNHYFQGNGTSNPIAMGKYPAQTLLREKHTSCVMGHNHLLDVSTDINAREERIWGFSAGCYFEHWEDYAGRNNARWWRGILILDGAKNGDIGGYRTISLARIKELYGGTDNNS
jgi:hypothetical protein